MRLKKREKILLVLGLIAISFYIFDLFYFTPRSRRVKALEGEIKATELKLQELTLLTKGMENIDKKLENLENKLKGISEKTLKGNEFRVFLNHLAKESDPIGMRIISIKPIEETDIAKTEVEIGLPLKRLNIQLILHSTFSRLENYLKSISNLPLLIYIDYLQLERNEEIYPFLRANLNISIYMALQNRGKR